MSLNLNVTVPLETVIAIRKAKNTEEAVEAFSKVAGTDHAVTEAARAIVKAIKGFPFDIKPKEGTLHRQIDHLDSASTLPVSTVTPKLEGGKRISFTVRPLVGDTERFTMYENETVSSLAQAYAYRRSAELGAFYFTRIGQNIKLDPDRSLAECGIQDGAALYVRSKDDLKRPSSAADSSVSKKARTELLKPKVAMDDMLLKAIAEDKAPKISPSSADTKPDPDSTITLCFIDLQGYRYEICGMKRNTRVQEVKEMLELRGGWPPVNQRLIFRGKQIQDDRTLQEHGIGDYDILHIVLALRGS